jgi:hypothetical protein
MRVLEPEIDHNSHFSLIEGRWFFLFEIEGYGFRAARPGIEPFGYCRELTDGWTAMGSETLIRCYAGQITSIE